MLNLSIVMAAYGQPKMLEVWWRTLAKYDLEMLAGMELVIVDDAGSPPVEVPKEVQESVLTVQLLRVNKDIPWNQPGARNLGMMEARAPVCVMLDPDMVIRPEDLHRFYRRACSLPRGEVVRFGIRYLVGKRKGTIDLSSPNTYLLHREDFLDAGGYDEDFAGHKGWSDVQLLDILRAHFKLKMIEDLAVDYYEVASVEDAMVTTLDRSVRENRGKRLRKVGEAKAVGGWKSWVEKHKRSNLRFPWSRVL